MPLRCFGLHQYIRAKIPIKDVSSVKPPIPRISLRVRSLTIEYGIMPEITIDNDTRVNVTPHFFLAKRAEEEIIPTIAAGQPRLMANVMLAIFSGGPKLTIKAIMGKAMTLVTNPTHARVQ